MATFPAKVHGSERLARNLSRAAAQIRHELDRSMRELGDTAELIYAAHALRRTGRMARNIVARGLGGGVLVTVQAKNPLTGFDYVAVTRFGHRVRRIVPTRRFAASTTATGAARATGRRAALRLTIGGKVLYRRSVKGFHPASDWAERALPQIEGQAQIVANRLGRRIEELVA